MPNPTRPKPNSKACFLVQKLDDEHLQKSSVGTRWFVSVWRRRSAHPTQNCIDSAHSGDRHYLICFDSLWVFHKALDGRKKRNFQTTRSTTPQSHPELCARDGWTYSLAALQGKWESRPMVTAKVEEINATRICTRPSFGNDSVFFEVRSLCCVWRSSGGKAVNVAKAPQDL